MTFRTTTTLVILVQLQCGALVRADPPLQVPTSDASKSDTEPSDHDKNPVDRDVEEQEVREPEKELSIEEQFDKFADEIEKEMERRELEGNKNLRIVRELQEQQRDEYRNAHDEIRKLHEAKSSRDTRVAFSDAVKRMRLAGARLNELEQRVPLLAATSGGPNRNNDLLRKVSKFSSELSRARRIEWQKKPEIQQRYNQLMQKVMASRNRHFGNQTGFTDLTVGLVRNELAFDTVRYPDHPGSQDGAIQRVRPALNRLLKLSWVGSRVTVDKAHWDELFAGRTSEDIEKDVDHLLKKNEVEMPTDERHGMPFRRHSNTLNVVRLFDNLRSQFGNVGGRSSSGNGSVVRTSFSSVEANSELAVKPGEFRFEIREKQFPRRLLMLEQNGICELTITIYGDVVLRFHQYENGAIKIVETMGTELHHREAESLGKLYLAEPEFIEERLFPLLHHVGIVPPASRFDPKIADRVVDRLRSLMQVEDVDVVLQLIGNLDSDEFKIRQAATKRLETKVDQYRELLIAAAHEDDASFETRSRIKYLLEQSSLETAHADSLINTLRLMKNAEFLAILMQQLDEQDFPPVGHRLDELTGETFGANVDAWRKWLADSKSNQLSNALGSDE